MFVVGGVDHGGYLERGVGLSVSFYDTEGIHFTVVNQSQGWGLRVKAHYFK